MLLTSNADHSDFRFPGVNSTIHNILKWAVSIATSSHIDKVVGLKEYQLQFDQKMPCLV